MANVNIPHFDNLIGQKEIITDSKIFMCQGAPKPYNHPKSFLNMGNKNEYLCPYCSTKFIYKKNG